jgi:hypothetical protein
VYYFNIVTRQSQWHLPSAFLDAREEEVKQASWMKLVDDAGRPYYYSTLSRRVQWTMCVRCGPLATAPGAAEPRCRHC